MSKLKIEYARGEVLADKYEVVDVLDHSPLGITYRVKHLKSGKYLRLLMLDPSVAGREQKDAIIQAVKTARSIERDNVLRVRNLGQHKGVAFVAIDDFAGKPLREVLTSYKVEGKQFTVREAAQITIQILDAVAAVHAAGCVLRSLRPEYVLIQMKRTGPRRANLVAHVRLFGAGLWDIVDTGVLAEDEFTRGEAQYLAPELKSLNPKVSHRADLYSVGAIFYELLIGATPSGSFQLPRSRRPGLPKHIDNVIELALANAPEDRYPAATDFRADVQRTFQLDESSEEDDSSASIHPLVWVLGAVLVAAMAVLLFRPSDPLKEAERLDTQLRNEVSQAHARPSTAEIQEVLANHPPNMAYIPAGPYVSGRLHQELDVPETGALAEVMEIDGFLIDVFEYPNLQGAPPEYGVTFKDAEKMCAEQGKRLCSADEFEKACKGPDNRIFGYGDTWDPDFCGEGIDDVHAAGALPDCKSGWGVYDISGNFREWTATKRSDTRVLVKGGLPGQPESGSRCAFATDLSTSFSEDSIGFRCCRDLDAEPYEPPAEDGDDATE